LFDAIESFAAQKAQRVWETLTANESVVIEEQPHPINETALRNLLYKIENSPA
jgi:hypothetical protein